MKKILYLINANILYRIIRYILRNKKRVIYYLISIVIIFLLTFVLNLIPFGFSKLINGTFGKNDLYDIVRNIYKISKEPINPYSIVFSFAIVAFFKSRIDKLDYPNKFQRAIWNIYKCGMNAIEKLELAFDLDNNHIITLRTNKDISDYIKEKINYINDLPHNRRIKVNISTAMGTNERCSIEKLFIKSINEIKKDTEFIMKTYIKYLKDDTYKNISQLNTDVSLYSFKSEQKLNKYNKQIMSDYLASIIVQINSLNEEWYNYYKPEIDKYQKKNEENNWNVCRVIDNKSIRKRRIERGLLIEEICNKIERFSIDNDEIKKEVLYRLIENGRVYPNEKDAEKISKQLGVNFEIISIKSNGKETGD